MVGAAAAVVLGVAINLISDHYLPGYRRWVSARPHRRLAVVVATVLVAAIGTLLASGNTPTERSDGTSVPSGPVEQPVTEQETEVELEQLLESLDSGIGEASFVAALGEPLRRRDLTADFNLASAEGRVREAVWLVGDRRAWVQTLADEDSTVWFFSVTSCDDDVQPSFRSPSIQRPIQLMKSRFDEIANDELLLGVLPWSGLAGLHV